MSAANKWSLLLCPVHWRLNPSSPRDRLWLNEPVEKFDFDRWSKNQRYIRDAIRKRDLSLSRYDIRKKLNPDSSLTGPIKMIEWDHWEVWSRSLMKESKIMGLTDLLNEWIDDSLDIEMIDLARWSKNRLASPSSVFISVLSYTQEWWDWWLNEWLIKILLIQIVDQRIKDSITATLQMRGT